MKSRKRGRRNLLWFLIKVAPSRVEGQPENGCVSAVYSFLFFKINRRGFSSKGGRKRRMRERDVFLLMLNNQTAAAVLSSQG